MLIFFFISIFFIHHRINAANKNDLQQLSNYALHYTYHFKFESADSVVNIMETQYPTEILPDLCRANLYWWLLLSGYQSGYYEIKYLETIEKALQKIENWQRSKLTFEQQFVFINTYALKTRFDMMKGKYMQALIYLKACIDVLEKTLQAEQSFPSFYLTSGLYNYFIHYAIAQYPMMKIYVLFYPAGSMDKGLKQLLIASQSPDILVKTEATYFLMKIYGDTKHNPAQAAYYAKKLVEMFPENLIYQYHLLDFSYQAGYNDKIDEIVENLKTKAQENLQMHEKQKQYYINLVEKYKVNK